MLEVRTVCTIKLGTCEILRNQKQHIDVILKKQSDQDKKDYRVHLRITVDCVRFLLRQGLAFRGRDESEGSKNKGNFLELLEFVSDHNEGIAKVIKRAPRNLKLTSPDVQKDLVNAAASLTTESIIKDIGDDLFAVLVDESRDISVKEQMAVILRYLDKKGEVVERFLGLVHVMSTTSLSLKASLESLFAINGLSLSRLRGQGYDGASNMQGEFNGLKSLILKENSCAYYVYCFAHQLQLALVAVAKKEARIAAFFDLVTNVVNIIGASCKRRDILREMELKNVTEEIERGEILTGRGLNQEMSLKRAGDTRWGSHFGTIIRLITMFKSVFQVLEIIEEDGTNSDERGKAFALLRLMHCFEFAFNLHLMKNVLGVTNELSLTLQQSDQDLINAMIQVNVSKERLQLMRNEGWDSLLKEVHLFCEKHDIHIPKMSGIFVAQGRSRRNFQQVTNLHHFQVELFYQVIDRQLQELNNRFTETNTELLISMASLNLRNMFAAFDKAKLTRFAQFYPNEFSLVQLRTLDTQLDNYIVDVRSDAKFAELERLVDLYKMMVQTGRHVVYPLVSMLMKLALILPVATATVERTFSAMHFIKNQLRNRMGDEWVNDCLITYIEKDIFDNVDTEKIMERFQSMKKRRQQL